MQNALETRIKDRLNLIELGGLYMYKDGLIEMIVDNSTNDYIVLTGFIDNNYTEVVLSHSTILSTPTDTLKDIIKTKVSNE